MQDRWLLADQMAESLGLSKNTIGMLGHEIGRLWTSEKEAVDG
jgi:hypothetical protein